MAGRQPGGGPAAGGRAGDVSSRRPLDVRVRPWWAVLAVASVVVLAAAAPAGILLLGFLGSVIALHEAGHWAVARRVGMVPTEFFWGFGPEVVAVDIGRCRYGLRALFLGGYVKLEGMTPASTLPDGFEEAGTYRAASHRARLATILAGPGVNLVTGVLAFAAAAMVSGAGPLEALRTGVGDLWFVVEATVTSLGRLAADLGGYVAAVLDGSGTTEAPVRFMSPVAQADASERAVSMGVAVVLRWFGVLSVAIGAINLVPLPPLDGGHAVVAAAEWVVRRVGGRRATVLDAGRLLPLAWATVGVLVLLSISAVVLDLRDLG